MLYCFRIAKFAWKRSLAPFDTVAKGLLVPISMVGICVVLKLLNKEKGDFVIWLSIAIPGVAFLIYFLWNVVAVHHQTHKKWSHKLNYFLILLVVVLSVVLYETQKKPETSEIHALNHPDIPAVKVVLTPSNSLPDITIPMPPISAKQLAIAPTEMKFETNEVSTDLTKLIADKRGEKITERRKNESIEEEFWVESLTNYTYAIDILHQILSGEATRRGDQISKTPGYFRCLPMTPSHDTEDKPVAEIKFTKYPAVDFNVILLADKWSDEVLSLPNGLSIRCEGGSLEMRGNDNGYIILHLDIADLHQSPIIQNISSQNGRDTIKTNIELLVAGKIESLNKSDKP